MYDCEGVISNDLKLNGIYKKYVQEQKAQIAELKLQKKKLERKLAKIKNLAQ